MNQNQAIDNNIKNSGEPSTDAVDPRDIGNNIYDSFSSFSDSDNISLTTEHHENSAASLSPTEDDSGYETTLDPPNDVVGNNQEVESLSHQVIKHFWNDNFSAPVSHTLTKGATILEVGCGVGAWLLDMAGTYSKSKFTGFDLLSMSRSTPTNVTFVQGNILEGLPFPDNSFDFVAQRFLSIKFSADEWRTKVINELVRVTKPGGWIELMEGDIELVDSGPETKRIIVALQHCCSKCGNNKSAGELHEYFAANDSLQQIRQETRDIECGGTTPIAQQARNDYGNFLMSVGDNICDSLKMSDNHYHALWEVVHNEMKRLNTKRPMHRVYAQKKKL